MKIWNTHSLPVFVCSLLATITFSVEQSRAATLVVTNTSDSGAGSLRQAILAANSTVNVPDVINFNITGVGPHTISPIARLPCCIRSFWAGSPPTTRTTAITRQPWTGSVGRKGVPGD